MDVFSFRDRVVEDYGQFSRSFTRSGDDICAFVDGSYGTGEYWPSPLIQLNPSFVSGGAIGELVEQGCCTPNAGRSSAGGRTTAKGRSCSCTSTSGRRSRSRARRQLGRHLRHGLRQVARLHHPDRQSGAGGSRGRGSAASDSGDRHLPDECPVQQPMEELQKYLGLGYP
jgi:hypothetical protein